ncbi:pyridoxal-phosphate dependent enzyme [Elusimicrobiota bacterium]
MTNYMSSLECLRCSAEFSPGYEGYICSNCGSNLDVRYDYDSISSVFSIDILLKNKRRDIWRYESLYPFEDMKYVPGLDMSLTPLYRNVSLEEETGLKEVYLKDDTRLPSGSLKDRAGAVVMTVAREKGKEVISCASTGNAGCSWACMAAACGVKVVIYVPHSAPRAKIAQLKVYGAEVNIVDGNYDAAYDLCVGESCRLGYFNRCTGYNPYTREGKKSVSYEIWEQLGYRVPGAVFVPVGDGNIISGVWKGFRDLFELKLTDNMPRLYAVQSSRSDAIVKTLKKIKSKKDIRFEDVNIEPVNASTRADSISVDSPRDGIAALRSVLETNGDGICVEDEYILTNIYYLAGISGIFAEPAGVTSVAGLRHFICTNEEEISGPVVCLITGNGLKDVDAVLKGN